jgi:surface protein
MQTAITATTTSVATVSTEAALKTTSAHLSTQISAIIGGAPPDTLNALAEIGAALNNENNFAGTVTTALGTKAAAADVSALSTALAQKADQTEYASLSSVVTTKTANTTANNTSTSIAMINNAITTLIAEVSTLQANGNGNSVNPDTVAVNNVSLTDLQNWTNEIYIKMGLTNADGTLRTILLGANGVTVKYVGKSALVPASTPLFIQANPRGTGTGAEWFAVVNHSTNMKNAISNYASSLNNALFTPPGQSEPVPFNNIVTTLMTDMSFLFNAITSFNGLIASWDTSNVTTMQQMFGNVAEFNQPIGAWNTAKVTSMNNMFMNAYAFNQPIGAWNTGAVTTMNNMFNVATAFNQNISAWNVANVSPTDFSTGSALTAQNTPPSFFLSLDANGVTVKYVGRDVDVPASEPLFIYANPRSTGTGEWFAVVKQSTTMKNAISNYASSLNNALFTPPGQTPVPFNNIVTTLMSDMSYMFNAIASFNGPIASWDTSNVTTMQQMIGNVSEFNQPIGAWNTAKVTNMNNMFRNALAFNQPIGAWNTGAVTDMSYTFFNAAAFNQPIGSWNTGAVTTMDNMFNGVTAFNQNISAWNVANVSPKPPTAFGFTITPPNWF